MNPPNQPVQMAPIKNLSVMIPGAIEEVKVDANEGVLEDSKAVAELRASDESKMEITQSNLPVDTSMTIPNNFNEGPVIFDNQKFLKMRRITYPHQDVEDGSLDGTATFLYILPAFSRNPLLMLVRYLSPLPSMYVSHFYQTLGTRITVIAFFMAFAWTLGMLVDPLVGYISGAAVSEGRPREKLLWQKKGLYDTRRNTLSRVHNPFVYSAGTDRTRLPLVVRSVPFVLLRGLLAEVTGTRT